MIISIFCDCETSSTKKPELLGTSQKSGALQLSTPETTTATFQICQLIVSDYLKTNGFEEILSDLKEKTFQTSTNETIPPPISLKKLILLNQPHGDDVILSDSSTSSKHNTPFASKVNV